MDPVVSPASGGGGGAELMRETAAVSVGRMRGIPQTQQLDVISPQADGPLGPNTNTVTDRCGVGVWPWALWGCEAGR